MEPQEWYEFNISIFQHGQSQQWVAEVTYGSHPDTMVTKSWLHPKLEVVRGLSNAYLLAVVARITGKPRVEPTEKENEDATQHPLW